MLDAANRASPDVPSAAAHATSAFRLLLEESWHSTEPKLAKLALGLGLKSDQAADVLQDVYITAIQKPPQLTTAIDLKSWLFQVTINRCHLEHRRLSRRQRLWSALVAAWRGSERCDTKPLVGELKAHVEQALATLTDLDRSLVVMRYFIDLNSREIGEIMDMPEATVRSRLRAARRKLAVELGDWNDGVP